MSTAKYREAILESIARTLWVTAWADEMEERGETKGWAGADLMDLAPETPEAARVMTKAFVERIEKENDCTVEDGFILALVADGRAFPARHERGSWTKYPTREVAAIALADSFGHYLAMEAMGHGVSWKDDHAHQPLKLPHGVENYELRDEVK